MRAKRLGYRVKTGKAQCEQMSSGLPLKADIAQYGRHVSTDAVSPSTLGTTGSLPFQSQGQDGLSILLMLMSDEREINASIIVVLPASPPPRIKFTPSEGHQLRDAIDLNRLMESRQMTGAVILGADIGTTSLATIRRGRVSANDSDYRQQMRYVYIAHNNRSGLEVRT